MGGSRVDSKKASVNGLPVLGQDLSIFCKEAGIELLILFGSRVTSFAGASSDIDLAVRVRRGLKISKLDLLYELEGFFHPERVDLVILSPNTPPLLQYEIFLKGRVLFEEADGLFEEGRLKAWNLYLDTAPLRKREIEYLKEFGKRMRHVT
jgi:predicted nucleotidyltransferase